MNSLGTVLNELFNDFSLIVNAPIIQIENSLRTVPSEFKHNGSQERF